MNDYVFVNGQVYKKSLLESAKNKAANTQEPALTYYDIQLLFIDALDNGFITNIEVNTLKYILQNFTFEAEAKEALTKIIARETPTQRSIQRALWEGNRLYGMDWVISDEEAIKQEKLSKVKFLHALHAMAHSFVYQMESSTSPRDILSLEKNLDLENTQSMLIAIQEAVTRGTLYLLPENYLDLIEKGEIPLGKPDFTQDFNTHWTFALHLPDLPTWDFIGFVNRNDPYDTYNTGYQVLLKR
jgi:hypothetical protein